MSKSLQRGILFSICVALVLALSLTLVFFAGGGDKNILSAPQGQVSGVADAAANAYEHGSDIGRRPTGSAETYTSVSTGAEFYNAIKSNTKDILLTTNIDLVSGDINLADGYYYMDMDGTKQKAEFPIADIITAATASGDSINMASGMMRNLRMSEENGVKTVSYDYDTAQLNALVKQAMDMAMADQAQDLSALLPGYTFDLNVTSCTGSMELGADNSLIGEDISMIMHYVIAGEGESLDLEMVMIMDYDFTSKGQPVTMPAVDPSAYTEIPSGGATYIGGADALTGITVTE